MYTYADLMIEVLKENGRAMSVKEMWEYACIRKMAQKLESVGKTPTNTMNALIHKDIKKGDNSRFKQVSKKPALFDLK